MQKCYIMKKIDCIDDDGATAHCSLANSCMFFIHYLLLFITAV